MYVGPLRLGDIRLEDVRLGDVRLPISDISQIS
mgnify:CR=1 FL=1